MSRFEPFNLKRHKVVLHPECCMRKINRALGHRIGSSGATNLGLQLSPPIILETKDGDMEHCIFKALTRHKVLDEAESGVAHVGEGGLEAPVFWDLLLSVEQLLLEHLALGRVRGDGAAGDDRTAANVAILLVVKADPCV